MNRIFDFLDPPEPEYGDFVVVSGPFGSVCVTYETACDIERQLDACVASAWVTFYDRVGSRMRIRADDIRCIAESTAEQRADDRRLDRAREREQQADRKPWEDE